MWLEIVKEAGPLFGDYLQEALASKLARVLPNNCVLLPHDKVKTSLLIVEKIPKLLYWSLCDDCLLLNMKNFDRSNEKEHCKHTFVANISLEQSETNTLDLAKIPIWWQLSFQTMKDKILR